MELQKIIFFSLLIFGLGSCTKELPVGQYDRGDVEEVQVAMGGSYENVVWVNLEDAAIVKTASKFSWDLAFLTEDGTPYLVLNEAVAMKAVITDTEDWNATINPADYQDDISADHASGDLDSIRAGQWWEHGKVVLLDMGINASSNPRGFCKFQGISYDNNTVVFKIARLDGSEEQTATITLDNQYTQQEYSFFNAEVTQVSPPKTDYDLIFTGYIEHFYDEGLEYQVTGVILNRYLTAAYRDTLNDFSALTATQITSENYTFDRNVIGYDWKYYDFDDAAYIIEENLYLIQNQNGYTFKLRFTDFYDETGVRGYPKFEVQLL